MRRAVKLRYAMLPMWYTLFYESHIGGEPIMRPLWYQFADDAKTFDMDDGYMVGDALLVNPVYDKGATSKVCVEVHHLCVCVCVCMYLRVCVCVCVCD